jgi:hypothetical protein
MLFMQVMSKCWQGYVQRGLKTSHHSSKNDPSGKGHQVHNCVKAKKSIKK